jgi:hypothetical protein
LLQKKSARAVLASTLSDMVSGTIARQKAADRFIEGIAVVV